VHLTSITCKVFIEVRSLVAKDIEKNETYCDVTAESWSNLTRQIIHCLLTHISVAADTFVETKVLLWN
jgi:hypothetical protein